MKDLGFFILLISLLGCATTAPVVLLPIEQDLIIPAGVEFQAKESVDGETKLYKRDSVSFVLSGAKYIKLEEDANKCASSDLK